MKSFRTEIENPIVEKDIVELARKIEHYKFGEINEEKFRSLRLARGVYGQRQSGVQMIRIKLPYGKVLSRQLHRIADVSDQYSTGRLHITTRQDLQIHHVDLDRTPELWAELERDDITLREACGNTVRNVTASETAGIDVDEPFDVSPYADAVFRFFLRNPICQEMGRKFKVSFSSSDKDTALSYMHDLGFIAKIKNGERGFKVMIGGGLGSQPRQAELLYNFLPSNKIVPLMEGILRIFDRYGERKSRSKARIKFLLKNIGLEAFKELLKEEEKAIAIKSFFIDTAIYPISMPREVKNIPEVIIKDKEAFKLWKSTNIILQKQKGYVAIGIKVLLGDFYTDKARILADLVSEYAAGEIRLTLRQNIIIPFVREDLIDFFYIALKKIDFVESGYNKTVDITACPGTDTCNLGISNSTSIARELERVIKTEYPEYVKKKNLVIKISGCMNACGQHNMANIGFQGMTIKTKDNRVAPALQVLLGGENLGNGQGRFADKVLKIPSKRGLEALRIILNDFEDNSGDKSFLEYYLDQGEKYFYKMLIRLSNIENITNDDLIDWGEEEKYKKMIGVGECAGVVIDLTSTLIFDSEEKLEEAVEMLKNNKYSNSIYHAYSAMINAAKALLISEDIQTNTQAGIVKEFDKLFIDSRNMDFGCSFSSLVYQIKAHPPSKMFAESYLRKSKQFVELVKKINANSSSIKTTQ